MNKYLLILITICSLQVNAQNDELNKLTDIVKSLQTGGEKSYNNAIAVLASDKLWTPMDEIGIDREAECKVSERVPGFRLNSVLTNAENKNRYQTSTGNHLNGTDTRYNYSLFEKTLKTGKSTSLTLPGRWGEQVIIIIPFKPQWKISAHATGGENEFSVMQSGNGILKLSGSVAKGHSLDLTITNESGSNISYAIINYNSRK